MSKRLKPLKPANPIESKPSTPSKYGRSKGPSAALVEALKEIKDYMNDAQKALIFLREGKSMLENGDFVGAIECFTAGINLDPHVNLFQMRAAAFKNINMFTEAYYDYSFIIRLEHSVGTHYCSRGLCCAKLKRLSLALEDLDTAVSMDPSPLHYYSRATVLSDMALHEAAVKDLTRALQDDSLSGFVYGGSPNNDLKMRCLYRRALANFDMKKYNETMKDLAAVLIMDPNSVPPRALLGRALKMMAELPKAEEQLTHAVNLEPDQPSHYVELGDVKFRMNKRHKIVEAIHDFDKGVKLLEEKIVRYNRNISRQQKSRKVVEDMRAKATTDDIVISHASHSNNNNNNNQAAASSSSPNKGGVGQHKSNPPVVVDAVAVSAAASSSTNNQSSSARGDGGANPSLASDAGGVGVKGILKKPPSSKDSQRASITSHNNSNQSSARSRKQSALVSTAAAGDGEGAGTTETRHGKDMSELDEQLADVLYRRAEAKLMIEEDPDVIAGALADSLRACTIVVETDYQLVTAVCYIRLGRFNEAGTLLEVILRREHENERALYHLAFCRKAQGRQKDAIEYLTKIISVAQKCGEGAPFAVPLGRVFETRGTLFHEIQSYKLALADIGRSVAITPDRPENYFLRADCHSKLGNYEQALMDYNTAENKGFADKYSLLAARGMVNRLLGRSENAERDFIEAVIYVPDENKTGAFRINALRALSMIDMKDYVGAYQLLAPTIIDVHDFRKQEVKKFREGEIMFDRQDVSERDAEGEDYNNDGEDSFGIHGVKIDLPEFVVRARSRERTGNAGSSSSGRGLSHDIIGTTASETGDDTFTSGGGAGGSLLNSPMNRSMLGDVDDDGDDDEEKEKPIVDPEELHRRANKDTLMRAKARNKSVDEINTTALRLEWMLRYHCALSVYHLQLYEIAVQMLQSCIYGDLRAGAPDDDCLGTCLFFCGLSMKELKQYDRALISFAAALETTWSLSERNTALCCFATAKTYQHMGKNEEAIEYFTKTLEVHPDWSEQAYVYFRRAWSYKAQGDFSLAGADFETAKSIKKDDPNFSVEYRSIGKCAFMAINSEPDAVETFPSLLPLHGMV